jgi:hypothetical protein
MPAQAGIHVFLFTENKGLLFLKKKKQKDFWKLGAVAPNGARRE